LTNCRMYATIYNITRIPDFMQKTKEVRFAVSENGKCHIKEWLLGLDAQTRARIHVRLVRLQYGAYGDYKRIDNKISELRFFFSKGYRIYFTEKDNKLILLLNGGDKSSQGKDIKQAKLIFETLKGFGEV